MTEDFDIWWKNYPRKINKAPAQKAYEKAVKKLKVDPTVLLKGVLAFSEEVRTKNIETDYIPHASTWLNQRRWENHETSATGSANEAPVPVLEPPTDVHAKIHRMLGDSVYLNWFADMTLGGKGGVVILEFPTKFAAYWVNNTYGDRICQILPGRIEFVSRA